MHFQQAKQNQRLLILSWKTCSIKEKEYNTKYQPEVWSSETTFKETSIYDTNLSLVCDWSSVTTDLTFAPVPPQKEHTPPWHDIGNEVHGKRRKERYSLIEMHGVESIGRGINGALFICLFLFFLTAAKVVDSIIYTWTTYDQIQHKWGEKNLYTENKKITSKNRKGTD